MAMNDSLLRKGDIVATNRGFVVFRGLAGDGITYQFEPCRIRPQPPGNRLTVSPLI
jgi:hypothetical protein